MNSTRTCVHCPCEPVLPRTLVTLASLMGCTRLVSMMAARRWSGGEAGGGGAGELEAYSWSAVGCVAGLGQPEFGCELTFLQPTL